MIGITRRLASNFPKNVRRMSGGANVQEEIKEMNKWKIVTYAAVPVCVIKAIFDFKQDREHHEPPEYPYLRIRNKEFPWGDDGLFESKHQ